MDQLTWRKRIGLVVVAVQTITETRFRRIVPEGISFFSSRMALTTDESTATRAIAEVAQANVDAIAYCCTSSGAHRGYEGDRAFCERESALHGTPVISTMASVVQALQHVGAKKVVLTSPGGAGADEAEIAYLAQAGIDTVASRSMNIPNAEDWSHVSPQAIYDFCLDAWDESADALVIACMNFDGMSAIDALEQRLGKPVITSHSATLWRTLATVGVDDPITGFGRLLAEPRCETVTVSA